VQDDVEPILHPVFLEGYLGGCGVDRGRQAETERHAGGNAGEEGHGREPIAKPAASYVKARRFEDGEHQ